MDPPVILVGGTAGCGKTTLTNRLLAQFDLDHRLGTGFIRAVVQSQTDPVREPWLFLPSYQAEDPIAHLRLQAERLESAVRRCIERAQADGTSLIVEGTHLLPELYHDAPAHFVVLQPPEEAVHRERLSGLRHTRRTVSDADFARIREVGRFYDAETRRFGVPSVRYGDDLAEVVSLLGLPAAEDGVSS